MLLDHDEARRAAQRAGHGMVRAGAFGGGRRGLVRIGCEMEMENMYIYIHIYIYIYIYVCSCACSMHIFMYACVFIIMYIVGGV